MTEIVAVADSAPVQTTTSEAEAVAILAQVYGLAATARRVSSELDETFVVRAHDGTRLVLKIASPAERRDALAFQTATLQHLAEAAPELPVPRTVKGPNGETIQVLDQNGRQRFVRLLTYLDGDQLSAAATCTLTQAEVLGQLLARLDSVLSSFRMPVPPIDIAWDITRAERLVPLAHAMADADERRLVLAALDEFLAVAKPRQPQLPRQVIHNDLNPHNVLVAAGDPAQIAGIIDFGDIVEAPRINDPAVALSYLIGKPQGSALAVAFIRGYRAMLELTALELLVLPSLVKARLAMTIALTEFRAARHPERASYIVRNRPVSLSGLRYMATMGSREAVAVFSGAEA